MHAVHARSSVVIALTVVCFFVQNILFHLTISPLPLVHILSVFENHPGSSDNG